MIIRPFQSKIVRNEHLDHVVLIAGLPIARRWCLTAMTSVENEDGILCTDGRVISKILDSIHHCLPRRLFIAQIYDAILRSTGLRGQKFVNCIGILDSSTEIWDSRIFVLVYSDDEGE